MALAFAVAGSSLSPFEAMAADMSKASSGKASPGKASPGKVSSGWVDSDHAQIRLVAAETAAGVDGLLRLGLHVRLEPGWKTYWRSPGEAGIPPRINWKESENLAAARMFWPAPETFHLFDIVSYGYHDEVVYPIQVRVSQPDQALHLRLRVDFAVCLDICIPVRADLALDLPVALKGKVKSTVFAGLVDKYAARVPGAAAGLGARVESAVVTGSGEQEYVEVVLRTEFPLHKPEMILEGPVGFRFGQATLVSRAGDNVITFRVPCKGPMVNQSLAGKEIRITVRDGDIAFEQRVITTGGG